MAKSIEQKLEQKRAILIDRTATALRLSKDEAFQLLSLGRTQSIRINSLKAGEDITQQLQKIGWAGRQFGWCPDGYTIETGLDPLRDSTAVSEGQVYIQNAASWLPVLVLDPQPGERILDVCAAPGGKTGHIAQVTRNEAHITANDNSRPRLARLQSNLKRLGVQNISYTLFDATQLSRKLEGQLFDKILLDAPCSGEGMMNIQSDKDMSTWSVAHIKRLQQLQKRLIAQAWHLLAPGGTLVYSTCTIAPEENESVVSYLLRTNENARLQSINIQLPNRVAPVADWNGKAFSDDIKQVLRLAPSSRIEAFFVAKICRQPVVISDDM